MSEPGYSADFIAIDFETANEDLSSICQVGIVVFHEGKYLKSWSTLVNPRADFSPFNMAIHGITEDAVLAAPTFPSVHAQVNALLSGNIVACHTAFDRAALRRACERDALDLPECRWIDTARVARRTWPEFAASGYGLASIAERLGVSFQHHDAAEDARACAEILSRALHRSDLTVDAWMEQLSSRHVSSSRIEISGDPAGPLVGEVAVFTGALEMPRKTAAKLAASVGCSVAASVTKETTMLVVGDQDIRRLAGQEKSAKHRKAEVLIGKGLPIRILCEADFRRLVADNVGDPKPLT